MFLTRTAIKKPPFTTPNTQTFMRRWNFFNKAVAVGVIRSRGRDPRGGLHGGIEVLD